MDELQKWIAARGEKLKPKMGGQTQELSFPRIVLLTRVRGFFDTTQRAILQRLLIFREHI